MATPPRAWLRWLALPIVALPLAWLLFSATFVSNPRDVRSALIGRPMPVFTLTTIDGREVTSESLAGRPVLVNFWASWCIPACVDEHPVLIEAQERHGDELAIIGILYEDEPTSARAFLDRYGDGGWPNLVDPGGRVAIEFGVIGPPETFLVDRDGIVRFKHSGPLTTEVLNARLAEVLRGGGTAEAGR